MLKPVDTAHLPTRLADMGVVRAQGADAVKFLQGQVSNDVARLTADRSVLAGLHNAQGRAIALLRMVLAGPDEILAILPRELAVPVAARLAKFVLRAKVKISDVSAEWEVAGVEDAGIAAGLTPASVGAARRDEEGRLWVCVATERGDTAGAAQADSAAGAGSTGSAHSTRASASRWLVASRAAAHQAEPRSAEADAALHVGSPVPSPSRNEMTPNAWHAADIAAGLPQVYAATTESFVAQMLNLDLLEGIAFDKGCYTGQEVIARAHYRGKVKRRMQRFRTREPAKLAAGDAGTLSDGRSFKVVDAVQLGDGRTEFLAVTNFSAADVGVVVGSAGVGGAGSDHAGGSVGAGGAGGDDAGGAPAPEHPPVNAEQLPLPYSLPT
jgi:folate-binding protein YgfZ